MSSVPFSRDSQWPGHDSVLVHAMLATKPQKCEKVFKPLLYRLWNPSLQLFFSHIWTWLWWQQCWLVAWSVCLFTDIHNPMKMNPPYVADPPEISSSVRYSWYLGMYPNDFGDPLTFHLALSLDQSFCLSITVVFGQIHQIKSINLAVLCV